MGAREKITSQREKEICIYIGRYELIVAPQNSFTFYIDFIYL